ncbi:MAG: DUF4349 domain-containing protein [Phycisphaerales bacterium]
MTTRDDLERAIEGMTAGPRGEGALWERALERVGREPRKGAAWRRVLGAPLPGRAVLTGLAACALLVLVVGAMLPSLGTARRVRMPAPALVMDPDRTVDISARMNSGGPAQGYGGKGGVDEMGRPVVAWLGQPGAGEPAAAPADRQVVRKATIELEAGDVAAAFAKAVHAVSEARGEYVQGSSLTGEGNAARGMLTLRVAAGRLGAALLELRGLGLVKNEVTSGEDVTSQAVDLEARLRNEQRVEAELLELLSSRAEAPLKDVLELRESLGRVREQIERLSGQRQHLSRLVSLATVLVIIRAPEAGEEKPAEAGLWEYFSGSVGRAWESGLAFLADTVAGLVRIAVGGVIWWGLAGAAIVVLLRQRKRELARGV